MGWSAESRSEPTINPAGSGGDRRQRSEAGWLLDTAVPQSVTTGPAAKPTRAERRARRAEDKRASTHLAYEDCNEITGPLTRPATAHRPVAYRKVGGPWRRVMLSLFI